MLLNLSNHPVEGVWNSRTGKYENEWTAEQIAAAEREFGEIVFEQFPMIPPEYSGKEVYVLVEDSFRTCKEILGPPKDGDAVMLSGEIVFCSMLSRLLLDAGYRVVCATTRREVIDLGGGRIEKKFKFIRFRDYSGN